MRSRVELSEGRCAPAEDGHAGLPLLVRTPQALRRRDEKARASAALLLGGGARGVHTPVLSRPASARTSHASWASQVHPQGASWRTVARGTASGQSHGSVWVQPFLSPLPQRASLSCFPSTLTACGKRKRETPHKACSPSPQTPRPRSSWSGISSRKPVISSAFRKKDTTISSVAMGRMVQGAGGLSDCGSTRVRWPSLPACFPSLLLRRIGG